MDRIDERNNMQHQYPTYGRQFAAYRWYKPIIVALIFAIVYLFAYLACFLGIGILYGVATNNPDPSFMFNALVTSYEEIDVTDPLQTVYNLGANALMIPCLALAALIVRDRPMSSYSSARGGWSHGVFWKCFLVAFVCKGIPILVDTFIVEHAAADYKMKFTIAGFIVLTIIGPLQCISEEYIFRGLLMQTIGSWVRIPVLAVILQSVLFAAAHPYNMTGKVAIAVSGLTFALTAWIARGIEASSALHVVNNMMIFYLLGLNMTSIGTDVGYDSLIIDIVTGAAYVVAIWYISRKTDWFNIIQKDDVAIANARYEEKRARKAARKAAKHAKQEGSAEENIPEVTSEITDDEK